MTPEEVSKLKPGDEVEVYSLTPAGGWVRGIIIGTWGKWVVVGLELGEYVATRDPGCVRLPVRTNQEIAEATAQDMAERGMLQLTSVFTTNLTPRDNTREAAALILAALDEVGRR